MKLLIYSDLHLEFSHGWKLPQDIEGDVLVLAGDIITFKNYEPLTELLLKWDKPVLYVAGNHEFYTQTPMQKEADEFSAWLLKHLPHVTFLQDEEISIDDVHFFGGSMWTDFANENPLAIQTAAQGMNDFRLIFKDKNKPITPLHTVELHKVYVEKLTSWFEKPLEGKRVVISHHAPVINPDTKYGSSNLQPAFNSLDMIEIIEKYQPELWIYGHTHECDDQTIGKTRIISNQLGYPNGLGGFEALNFDRQGKSVKL